MLKRVSNVTPAVLKLPDFRALLATRMLVMAAWIAQDVITGWQVYSITRSPLMLGLIGLAEAIPALLCALVAGHIVDISRPYRVLLISISVLATNSAMMLAIGGSYLAMPGGILPWLFVGIVISGLARAFIMPSSFALLPRVVSRDMMPSATAFLAGSFQCAAVLAPAIAGLIYGGYTERAAWFIPTSFFGMALLIFLLAVSKTPRHWRGERKREPAFISIKAGWKFILTNKYLLSVMTLDMFAVLFGGAVAMLPAYADQVLHVGSEGLGILRASPAIGAITVALFLAVRPFKMIHGTWLLWVVAGFGACMIGFGMSTSFPLSVMFLIASGAFDSVSMVIRGTLMQWLTPDEMRGRVSSVNSMFIISSNEIGAFESGMAAKLLGLVPSVIFGGICTLGVVATMTWITPALRKLKVEAIHAK